ncbi:MAG: hypothetical protein H8D84_01185 [Proteobacteria bacterium]|nr:hypothetical protein [Pseudomonadota bacterium]
MSKTKNYYWDQATKFLEAIQTDIEQGILTNKQALEKMMTTDVMLSLEGIENKQDAEEFIDSIGGLNLKQV